MLKHRIQLRMLTLAFILAQQAGLVSADTWRLEQDQQWKPAPTEGKDKYLMVVARTEKLINARKTEALRKEWAELKKQFPEIDEQDLDLFIQAELLLCKRQFIKAVRTYDKFLGKDYQDSELYEAALRRQFSIAKAFLAGQKKSVFGIFKMKAHAEGIKIMERITERADDREIAVQAAVTVAKYYENKRKFSPAYLKWSEISWQWPTGEIAKDALLGMARCKYAAYKGPNYNAANLRSAKSYYTDFKARYPEAAEELGIDKTLKQIDEQLAHKQFNIGRYYQRTGNRQAANLHYDMVIQNWPESDAAQLARQMLGENLGSEKMEK